jgi:hypothetical protein
MTKCCHAYICTECFLQVRPQKEKQSTCPFCNCSKLQVSVAKKPTEDDIQTRHKEEQSVMEARIRGTNNNGNGNGLQNDASTICLTDHETTNVKKKSHAAVAPDSPSPSGFGSELEKDERFQMLKKRSESFASNEGNRTPQVDNEIIKSIAMTPEERRRLEAEMRTQLSHPLTLQVEAEAQERMLQNEQTYQRNNPGSSNSLLVSQRAAEMMRHGRRRQRGGSPRDWNSIVDAFERGGNGEVGSLDDLVVLEAAILLSMEAEARRSRDGDNFDAEQHAREGFPLVRSFLSGQVGSNISLRRGEDIHRMADMTGSSPSAVSQVQEQALARSLRDSQQRNQAGRTSTFGGAARYFRGMGDAALDTASMMMRGISEEEQIAMAIAASLQEQNNNPNTQNSASTDGRGPSDATGNDEAEVEVSEGPETFVVDGNDAPETHVVDVDVNDGPEGQEESDEHVASEVIGDNYAFHYADVQGLLEVSGNTAEDDEVGSHQELQQVQESFDVVGESITINELARVVTDNFADESSASNGQKDGSSPTGSLAVPDVSLDPILSENGMTEN